MLDGTAQDHWTPLLVQDAAVSAVKWLDDAVGRVGPKGFRSALPRWVPTLEERIAEGWGPPESDDEDPRVQLVASPEEIARHHFALSWVALYLRPIDVEMARCTNAWLAAKARRRSFPRIVEERGLRRTYAYTLKDRGLSIISVRLDRRDVFPWGATSDLTEH